MISNRWVEKGERERWGWGGGHNTQEHHEAGGGHYCDDIYRDGMGWDDMIWSTLNSCAGGLPIFVYIHYPPCPIPTTIRVDGSLNGYPFSTTVPTSP